MSGRISLKQLAASGAAGGQIPVWNAATGTWQPHLLVPANLSTASSEGTSSTALATFQTKLQLVTPSLLAGTYYLTWYCEFDQGNSNGTGEAQVLVDGVTIADYSNKFPVSNAFTPFTGFYILGTATPAAHTLLVQYRSPAGAGTVTIQRTRLVLWQIG